MSTVGSVGLRQVPVMEPSGALDEAIALLEAEPLGAVALVGDEMFMGLFDTGALESSLIPPGVDLSTVAVGPYIHPTRTVSSQVSVVDALALMVRRNLTLLPVVDGNMYQGIVTRADLETKVEG